MPDGGDVTVGQMILKQLERLTNSVNDQGNTLSSMETAQEYITRDVNKITEQITEIAKNQMECPARNGYQGLSKKVDAIPPKNRKFVFGRVPIPTPQEIIPWLVAIGAGVAAAMGWVG